MGRITKHNWTLVRHAAGGAALLGFCISIGAARAADANVQVAPCGLRVVGEGYGGDNGLRPFNWAPGVTVALMVTAPDGGLIELDDDACKMEKLVDDKGTNLLVDPQYSRAGISGMADVSDDGKALLAEINGGGVPVKGASSIHAVGAIAVRCAKEKKSHKAENVAVKADEKAAAGPVTFTLKEVGKPDWGDKPLRITLEAQQDLGAVAGVRFLDAGGKEIESSRAGSMSMSFGDTVQESREYDLAQKVDTVTIEVTYWTDMKTVEVPFDLTVTVGLK